MQVAKQIQHFQELNKFNNFSIIYQVSRKAACDLYAAYFTTSDQLSFELLSIIVAATVKEEKVWTGDEISSIIRNYCKAKTPTQLKATLIITCVSSQVALF